ncbi:MAG: IS200/IS605 family transposase [Caldilineaceae bacterium]
MPHSLAKIYLHLVFSTKYREPLLIDEVRDPLHRYMATVLNNLKCHTHLINSLEDHAHILFELYRTITISAAVEEVKKSSSKWLKTQPGIPSTFAWQGGYGVFSVSASGVDTVYNYIARQQEHHRKDTFQNELRTLLKKYKIDYDERYLWD